MAPSIVDPASDARLIEPTAQLLLDVFRNRTEDWQDSESARQEVLASLAPDRISRVLVDESVGASDGLAASPPMAAACGSFILWSSPDRAGGSASAERWWRTSSGSSRVEAR